MKPEQIFIGGPASAGTTLVAILLNKHPEIWCGEEASIFDRPALFNMGGKRLGALMKVESYNELDQSMPYTITIVNPQPMSYCGLASWRWQDIWTTPRETIIEALESNYPPLEVIEEMMKDTLTKTDKTIWAEKSPGNVFCMGQLKRKFPSSKRLVVIRNPYDCIMSLCFHRNFSLNNAVMRWIVSMDAAIDAIIHYEAHVVNYDRLIHPDHQEEELHMLHYHLEVEDNQEALSAITGEHNTWDRYKDQLGDGAVEVIKRSVVDLWERYCQELGIDEGDFEFPTHIELPTVDGEGI